MSAIVLTLPWPAPELWTNAKKRVHWRKVNTAVGLARYEAQIVTREVLAATKPPAAPTALNVTFRAPTARRYDTANALEACKPYIDGICDALGIDDSVFVSVCCERAEPDKNSAGVTLEVQ